MEISEGIETGKKYYWKRSNGWDWFDGKRHWWEYFVEFSGFNGAGGVWIIVHSRWNDGEWMFHQPDSLSAEKSQELIEQVTQNMADQRVTHAD